MHRRYGERLSAKVMIFLQYIARCRMVLLMQGFYLTVQGFTWRYRALPGGVGLYQLPDLQRSYLCVTRTRSYLAVWCRK